MKKLLGIVLGLIMLVSLGACSSSRTEDDAKALTDAEWEQVQLIFTEYIGKEIEYKPAYCGEWREGKQYKTENYAKGQYLINMDTDGYVHLVVWIEDGNRTVKYNRLDDEKASPVEND